jgi:hypothetical protein
LPDTERASLLLDVRDVLIPSLQEVLDRWHSDYQFPEDPVAYFFPLEDALREYRTALAADALSVFRLDEALGTLAQLREAAYEEYPEPAARDVDLSPGASAQPPVARRSFFDDVDD